MIKPTEEDFKNNLDSLTYALDDIENEDPELYKELVDICNEHKAP